MWLLHPACSLEYWAFELLVLIAGLLPNSTVSTSLIAMWYVSRLDRSAGSDARVQSIPRLIVKQNS
jgi:hypothetical protein